MTKYIVLRKYVVSRVFVCVLVLSITLFNCSATGYADSEKLSLSIPGVSITKDKEYTKFATNINGDTAYTMVPQGICFINDYVVFTGYDSDEKRSSVIWIKNTKTDALVATVELPDKEHIGGICFDGEYIWIPTKSNYVRFIRFSDIEKQIEKGYKVFSFTMAIDDKRKCCVGISIESGELKTGTKRSTSTVTYFDGYFYTAEFNGGSIKNPNPKLTKFSVSYKDEKPSGLTKKEEYSLPDKVQGIQLYAKKDTLYVILSCSYGRTKGSVSCIKVYKLSNLEKCIKQKDLSKNSEYLMIEGITIKGKGLIT